MRPIIRIIILTIILFPATSQSSSYSDKNTEKPHWFYDPISYAGQKFQEWLTDAVDNAFEESMYQILGEAIGQKFGESLAEHFSGFVSIGPFLSVTDLLGLGRKNTESQVMLKILLEAIENAKQDIINSVELQFQDETEARLNAIIRDLDIYNARSTESRMTAYTTLTDLISHANYVLARIEQKTDKYADNLHRYTTLAALQIQMQKEYTRWLVLTSNPSTTEEEIESETMTVLSTQIAQVDNFISNSQIGTISFWRNTFNNEFSNRSTVSFLRRIPENEIPFIEGVSNKVIRHGGRVPRTEIVNLIEPEYSGYYSYKMGSGTVEFMLLFTGCQNYRTYGEMSFHIVDAAGNVSGQAIHRRACTEHNKKSYVNLPRDLINSLAIQRAIDNHMNDNDAFMKYLREGYQPIREVVSQWRLMAGMTEKPVSEIDTYMDSYQ